jgi:hypothetical protein
MVFERYNDIQTLFKWNQSTTFILYRSVRKLESKLVHLTYKERTFINNNCFPFEATKGLYLIINQWMLQPLYLRMKSEENANKLHGIFMILAWRQNIIYRIIQSLSN